MKTLRLLGSVLVILFMAAFGEITAQTYQFQWTNTFTGAEGETPGMCLGHQIVGSYTYHVTFHVNPQTGVVEQVHNNVISSDLIDLVTGEKLKLMDTGHDAINFYGNFLFWNWITGADLPVDYWPDEGTMVWANFKWISPGGVKVTMRENFQLHRNASGDVTVYRDKFFAECNE